MSAELKLARRHLQKAARRLAEQVVIRDAYEVAHPSDPWAREDDYE
jgi:hypothetical protein